MKTIAYAAVAVLASTLLFSSASAAQPFGGMQGAPQPGPYEAGFLDGMRAAMAHAHEGGGMMHRMGGMGQGYGEAPAETSESGAHFELVRGDAKIDVKCPAKDSTSDCVQAAITLMDHVAMEKKEMAQAKASQQAPGTPPPPPGAGQPTHQ